MGGARRTAGRILGVLALAAVVLWFFEAHTGLSTKRYRTWNWYHYYVGSEYFPELGYFDLYEQTIAAQREDGGTLAKLPRIRDLETRRVVPVRDSDPYVRSEAFTDARWERFKRDVGLLARTGSEKFWRGVLLDRGYNPSPAWDAVAAQVSHRVDLANPSHVRAVKLFDMVGLVAVGLALAFAFGVEAALLCGAALLAFPPNPPRYLGGFLQYDWLYLILLVPPLLSRRRHGLAGFALGLAAIFRIFPAVLLGGFLARAGFALWDEGRIPRRYLSLLAGFALACVLGLGAGLSRPHGAQHWREFAGNISLHNDEMTYGNGRVGLKHVFTQEIGSRDVPSDAARRRNLSEQYPLYLATAGLVMGLLALALRSRDDVDSYVLATVAFFVLTVASHYYWSVIALWPLLGRTRSPPSGGWRAAGAAAVALVPTGLWYVYSERVREEYLRYVFLEWCLLAAFLALLGALIATDLRAAGGLTAWLARRERGEDPPARDAEAVSATR